MPHIWLNASSDRETLLRRGYGHSITRRARGYLLMIESAGIIAAGREAFASKRRESEFISHWFLLRVFP